MNFKLCIGFNIKVHFGLMEHFIRKIALEIFFEVFKTHCKGYKIRKTVEIWAPVFTHISVQIVSHSMVEFGSFVQASVRALSSPRAQTRSYKMFIFNILAGVFCAEEDATPFQP